MLLSIDGKLCELTKKALKYEEVKLEFNSIDDLLEDKFFSNAFANADVLQWYIGKPRPSIVALVIVEFILRNAKNIKFDKDAYFKYVSLEMQRDLDSAFIRKFDKKTVIESGWNGFDFKYVSTDNCSPTGKFAYVTYYSGRYVLGVLALICSLRKFTDREIIVLTKKNENTDPLNRFSNLKIRRVNNIENPFSHGQDRFKDTFNKLHIFDIFGYDRITYIDSDCIVLKDLDHLFANSEPILACQDWGNKMGIGFNSGFFSFKPSLELKRIVFDGLKNTNIESNDGGDQGYLNFVLKGRVSFLRPEYNFLKRWYDKRPWLFDLNNVYVLHYVGAKPWDIYNFDKIYEELNCLWLHQLDNDSLIDVIKCNRVFISRRFDKWKRGQETTSLPAIVREQSQSEIRHGWFDKIKKIFKRA